MSKELASLTLGDAGAALLLERAPTGSDGIQVAGFTTVADYSRLCVGYPKGHEPGARMFTDARGLPRGNVEHSALASRGTRRGGPLDARHRSCDHPSDLGTGDPQGDGPESESFGEGPRHDAVITVDRYGNTASTTHTVALVEELEAGHIRPGETVALISLASGLEIGVVILTLDEELVERYGHRN